MRNLGRFLQVAIVSSITMMAAVPAMAEIGDVYRVTGERVNLRSGPSDAATVRSTVERGDEMIELRRDGGWVGVRVARTGEEGWIFRDLVERVAQSQLVGIAIPPDAGFRELSPEFNQLIGGVGEEFGYPLINRVEVPSADTLRVTPSPNFLLNTGRDTHMAIAMAIYELWKNHQNQRPVRLDLLGWNNAPYITIEDLASGPRWSVEPVPRS
jgi:uncharacterized protein YgiM (DUF1202 family)